jgi:arylsulfatase A-like enzyme
VNRRILLAAAVGVLAATALVWHLRRGDVFRLPSRIAVEDVVADLSGGFQRDAVVEEAGSDPVRVGVVEPGDRLRGAGARTSLVAPPRSRIRFQVAVPSGGALRFAFGVEGKRQRETGRAGIRFSVALAGREIYSRVVNPAATRHDRQWFDEHLDLAAHAGRSVEIELTTELVGAGLPPAGTPGWSRVRLVRETPHARQTAGPSTPNVVVLLVDTLRADRLGCYGAHPSPSPTLDRVAADGLLFVDAVSQSSWTMPSVASLMTGLHPHSHGILGGRAGGDEDAPNDHELLADPIVTWAEEAAQAGVTTVGISANPLVSRATNMTQGFETFVELPWSAKGMNWATATAVNRTFLRWLERNRSYRFVAYLHYMEPHDPYTPPVTWSRELPADIAPALARGWIRDTANQINWHGGALLPADQIAYLRRLYDGEIHAWDTALSELLAALAELGVRDHTVLVITADHGEEFQEHGHLAHGGHLYEESIHVPLVIAGPGIAPGRRSEQVQGIDLFPTLAGIVGIPTAPGLAGHDLLAQPIARPAIIETGRGIAPDGSPMPLVAVRDGGWKLIQAPALGRAELYDVRRDPGEHDDRHGAEEGARLAHWLVDAPAGPPPPTPPNDNPALHERLRALGYVE